MPSKPSKTSSIRPRSNVSSMYHYFSNSIRIHYWIATCIMPYEHHYRFLHLDENEASKPHYLYCTGSSSTPWTLAFWICSLSSSWCCSRGIRLPMPKFIIFMKFWCFCFPRAFVMPSAITSLVGTHRTLICLLANSCVAFLEVHASCINWITRLAAWWYWSLG